MIIRLGFSPHNFRDPSGKEIEREVLPVAYRVLGSILCKPYSEYWYQGIYQIEWRNLTKKEGTHLIDAMKHFRFENIWLNEIHI